MGSLAILVECALELDRLTGVDASGDIAMKLLGLLSHHSLRIVE